MLPPRFSIIVGSTFLQVRNLLGELDGAPGSRAADVVHQNVDRSELLQAGLGHRCHFGVRCHVAGVRNDELPRLAGQRKRLLEARRVAVHREDARAFFGESDRNRAAVAPALADTAGTGDDRHLVLKSLVHESKR
jgi:hypothetical protein